jgi:predicted glycosyltransferase
MLSLFSLADIVICQGSYNTLAECINLNKNIICFPRHERELNEANRYAKYYNKIKVVNILNDTSK